MYEIKTAGAKGLGVFATHFIPRGTRIFSERPLLAIKAGQDAGDLYPASRLLNLEDQRHLMNLSFYVNKELSIIRWSHALWYTIRQLASRKTQNGTLASPSRYSIFNHVAVLNIFRSNAFSLGGSPTLQQAVFGKISRINHSCVPNAQGNFNEAQGRFNVHATRDIKADEEVSLNYLLENGSARASRQEHLLAGYGFTCGCPACDMNLPSARKGEAKRMKFHDELARINAGLNEVVQMSTESELLATMSFIELLKGEGITGREMSSL